MGSSGVEGFAKVSGFAHGAGIYVVPAHGVKVGATLSVDRCSLDCAYCFVSSLRPLYLSVP